VRRKTKRITANRGIPRARNPLWERSENSPPKLGGVAAPLRRCRRRHPLYGTAGVVPQGNHPVCGHMRWLRGIFFMAAASPPNLGGEFFGNVHIGPNVKLKRR